MGLGVIGLEGNRLAIGGDGLVELAFVSQGIAEIVVGLGVVGLEGDGLAIGGDGLFELPFALSGQCQDCSGLRHSRA